MFNLFGNKTPDQPEAQSPMQQRAINQVSAITAELPPMAAVLLNNYLPGLWANLSDDKIAAMCGHIRKLCDHIEHGADLVEHAAAAVEHAVDAITE